jgi:hypothetical protein
MINEVRNTVLSVLNKNNYGYISPSDFNLYAEQAQLDLFSNYFYQYNYTINAEKNNMSHSGYADMKKNYAEVIEQFSETLLLPTVSLNSNLFYLPQSLYTGNDYYLINKVLVFQKQVLTSTTTANVANELVDANVDFVALGVEVGDTVVVATENTVPLFVSYQSATVTSILSPTQLGLSLDIAQNQPQTYFIFRGLKNELENVTLSKITMLQNMMLAAPNRLFPAYTQEGNILTSYPEDITAGVICQYFRYPFQPRWTYTTLAGGEPIFNPNDPDYQDFELPMDDQVDLTMTILQYCGIEIREMDVYKYAQAEQQEESLKEKLT